MNVRVGPTNLLIDLVVVGILIPAGTILLAFLLRFPGSEMVFAYYALPALYLCLRSPKNYTKILFASIVLGLLLGMAYDLGAELNYTWHVNYASDLLGRIAIGNTPLGDFLWAFLIPFYTIVFYEHFIDDERRPALSRNTMIALIAALTIFIAACILVLAFQPFPRIPYAYLVLGAFTVVPLVGLLAQKRSTIHKLLLVSAFFFLFNLVGELAWLNLGQGRYPGEYIAWVGLFGTAVPVEELLYWTLLSTPAFIFCYEWLFDDFK